MSTAGISSSLSGEIAPGLSALAEALRRSTVKICDSGEAAGSGIGSGVVWDDGLVITNAHVLGGRGTRQVASAQAWNLELASGRTVSGTLEKVDPHRDVAAIGVASPGLEALPRRSDQMRVGELVVAVGHPFGVTGAVATGIIHAIGPVPGLANHPWIQADIRLAPGNSGGPLADATGNLVGINSMIARGLGLAIPAASVEEFLHDDPRQPVIGVTVEPVAVRVGRRRIAGLFVSAVVPGQPADQAGIRPGDIFLGCGEEGFQGPGHLLAAIRNARGKSIQLELLRSGRQMAVELGVGA